MLWWPRVASSWGNRDVESRPWCFTSVGFGCGHGAGSWGVAAILAPERVVLLRERELHAAFVAWRRVVA